MDLNKIIIFQIEKVHREESAKKEAARIQAKAAAVVRDEEEAKEKAIRLEKDRKNFASEKKVFEESFVREIMANIIMGLNSSKNKDFLPLREQIIKRYQQRAPIWFRSKFFLDKPYSFTTFPYYSIFLKHDCQNIIYFSAQPDGQIKINLKIFSDYEETLSSNKEEAAVQIINFLMTR